MQGVNLFTHWPAIERERRIPWDVHAGNMALEAWGVAGSEMHNQFYSTKTENFTELELLMSGWHPVEETGIPGFATVSTEEALAVLGLVGGQHPEIDHPTTEFTVNPTNISINNREVREINLMADGRAEFPVRYVLTTADIPWATAERIRNAHPLPPGNVGGRVRSGGDNRDRRSGRSGPVVNTGERVIKRGQDMTDEMKATPGKPGAMSDHAGKPSNIRMVSMVSMAVAAGLALAPLWGGPVTEVQTLALFALGGPGLKVWQAVGGGDPK